MITVHEKKDYEVVINEVHDRSMTKEGTPRKRAYRKKVLSLFLPSSDFSVETFTNPSNDEEIGYSVHLTQEPIRKGAWDGTLEDAKRLYDGRVRLESRSADYCGSCPFSTHLEQLQDPASWVHSSISRWRGA